MNMENNLDIEIDRNLEKYQEKYNETPDVYAAYSYDLTYIIANALKYTDKTGEKIKKYLRYSKC